MKVFVYCN